MGIDVTIRDDERSSKLELDRSLRVTQGYPRLADANEAPKVRYFAGYLSSSGVVSIPTDGNMNSNGSSVRQEYYISADQTADIHITHAVIVIADTQVVHNNFGNIAALANGWDLNVEQAGISTPIINKAKTGGQVIAQAGSFWGFGDDTSSFELVNWTGLTDAQLINFPLVQIVPGGIVLARGSVDRIVSFINDDLEELTEFTVRVLGYKRFP